MRLESGRAGIWTLGCVTAKPSALHQPSGLTLKATGLPGQSQPPSALYTALFSFRALISPNYCICLRVGVSAALRKTLHEEGDVI